jgi:hypothetical protein
VALCRLSFAYLSSGRCAPRVYRQRFGQARSSRVIGRSTLTTCEPLDRLRHHLAAQPFQFLVIAGRHLCLPAGLSVTLCLAFAAVLPSPLGSA